MKLQGAFLKEVSANRRKGIIVKRKRNYIPIVLISLAIAVGALMLSLHQDGNYFDETKRNPTNFADENIIPIVPDMTTPITTVTSPEIDAPKELPIENSEFKSISDGFSFSVPKGYAITSSGNTYYIRNKDNTIQMALVITSDVTDSPTSVYNSRSTYLNRMTALYDGEEHRLFTIGTSDRTKKEIGSYIVSYECVEAWFKNDNDKEIYKTTAHTYYTIFKESGEEIGPGMIITTFSNEDIVMVINAMDYVLNSLSIYEPTAEDLRISYELSTYQSPKADKAILAYPSGWTLSENSNGMVIISSTDDASSPYAGMIIEYLADEENDIVDDYAQFCGNYEYDILLPYFVQPVGDNAFNYRTAVTKTNLHALIGSKECISFDITDEIVPISKSVQYSMMSDNFLVNNIRYTFSSNGVDCMLNFIIPNEYCRLLIQNLLSHSEFF